MNSALLSSKKMDYCTPQGFFDTLNAEFHFTLDAAATEKSAKCKNFYTPETDGLTAPWNIGGGAYFDELRRVAKHYIVWGCNYFSYEFASGRIVWDKCKKGTSFSDCELAATDLFNTVRLFRFMWNGMLQGKSVAEGHIMQGNKKLNEQRIHPTQKPVALYDWIFQNYAAPGCRVLDTHLGSGSSRIAAYEAGVDFIGFEIDPIYYAAEEQRFLDYTSQTSLFHLT